MGETGAEAYETWRGLRKSINPAQIAAQTALGAIPIKGAGVLATAGKSAGMGALASIATPLAEGQTPTVGDVALGAGTGGVFGAGTAKLAQLLRVRPTGVPAETPRLVVPVETPTPKMSRAERVFREGNEGDLFAKPSKGTPVTPPIHAGIETRAVDPDWATKQAIDIEANPDAYSKARRGRVSVEDMVKGAASEPVSVIKTGKNFESPEQFIAYEQRNKAAFDRYKALLEQEGASPEIDAELADLRKAIPKYAMNVYGARSEGGRTLRAMQVKIAGQIRTIPEIGLKQAYEQGL
ncbi:MAG: hypothetical protein WC718_13035, partial [Phycisphaerales bacterium]